MSSNNVKVEEEVTTILKDQSTIDLSTNDHDNISDITKEEIVIDESFIGGGTAEKKNHNKANSFAETMTIGCPPSTSSPASSFWKKFSIRNLESIESDPREFSHIKKRLILATVALATSMYVTSSVEICYLLFCNNNILSRLNSAPISSNIFVSPYNHVVFGKNITYLRNAIFIFLKVTCYSANASIL
jgi:hypothetical protein